MEEQSKGSRARRQSRKTDGAVLTKAFQGSRGSSRREQTRARLTRVEEKFDKRAVERGENEGMPVPAEAGKDAAESSVAPDDRERSSRQAS